MKERRYEMTEEELREKCGMKKGELIDTNIGLLDILGVRGDIALIGVLATGKIIEESVESVITKVTLGKKGV